MRHTLTCRATAIATLLLLAGSSALAGNLKPRIIGGSDAAAGNWPFAVAVLDSMITASDFDAQFCGGSLIDPEWVLTAAHCVHEMTPPDVQVIPGAYILNASGRDTHTLVDAIVLHPDYDPVTLDSDLALLHLATPATSGTVALDSGEVLGAMALADNVAAIGWGTMSNDPATYPTVLQEVSLDYIPLDVCGGPFYYGSTGDLTATMFCAGVVDVGGVRDTCYGDSGGPLLRWTGSEWRQVGITSSGAAAGCAVPENPGVYTRVGMFSAWIAAAQQEADVAVSTAALPGSTTARSTVLRVTVLNRSPTTVATGTQLTLALSGQAHFADPGGLAGCTGTHPLVCQLGDIGVLGTVYREVTINFDDQPGTVTFTATATNTAGDFNPANNQSSHQWVVSRPRSGGSAGALAPLLLAVLLAGLPARRWRRARR